MSLSYFGNLKIKHLRKRLIFVPSDLAKCSSAPCETHLGSSYDPGFLQHPEPWETHAALRHTNQFAKNPAKMIDQMSLLGLHRYKSQQSVFSS